MNPLLVVLRRHAAPLAFFVVGLGFAWYGVGLNRAPGETGLAAISLLDLGYIGNPYLLPSGPTAHVSPLLTWFLAGVYALCGPNTAAARFVLGVVAAGLYALGVGLALRLCARCRPGGAAPRVALALFVLVPFFLFWLVVYARQWDQPFSALVLLLGWAVFEQAGTDARPYRAEALLAALAGIGALLSPGLLPPLGLALGVTLFRRRRRGDWRRAVLLSLAILAALLLPWGLRNEAVMGEFILTRSNGPLELAVGNTPEATGISGSDTLSGLHPHDSLAAAQEVQRVGELGYMREMRARAFGWIAADPWRFVRLTLRRAVLCFLPPPAMLTWHPVLGAGAISAVLMLFGVLRLAALVGAVALGEQAVAGLLFTLLPLAPYFFTHVNTRYLSEVYFTSVVLIALVLDRVWQGWALRGGAVVAVHREVGESPVQRQGHRRRQRRRRHRRRLRVRHHQP